MEDQNKDTQGTQGGEFAAAVPPEAAQSETGAPTAPVQNTETPAAPAKNANVAMFIGIALALIVLAGLYWFMQRDASLVDGASNAAVTISVDPAQVVATVNGTELFGKNLNLQTVQVAQASGIVDLSSVDTATQASIQSQALDAIINTELIAQAARTNGLTATSEEVEIEYARIAASIGGEEVALARLTELGTTVENFKGDLVDDILIQKYLTATNDESAFAVSSEEIEAIYNQAAETQEGLPSLEEVRSQIEQQLQFQKQQASIQTLVNELRAAANIEKSL